MEKERSICNYYSNSKSNKVMISKYNKVFAAICYRSLIFTLLITLVFVGNQVNAQCTGQSLACNNLVLVSLDSNCMAVLSPSVMLEGDDNVESFYRLEIHAPDSTYIWDEGLSRSDVLRHNYDGALLETRVYCKSSGIYCWGNIKIVDLIKPTLVIEPLDTAISCYAFSFDLAANTLVTKVSFSDNGCSTPDSLGITDVRETNFPCSDTVKIIRRTWSVVDDAGNRCDTTQTIHLLRGKLADVVYPKDTIIDCLNEGDISTAALGTVALRECENFQIAYQDNVMPVCGIERNILRKWIVTDLCNNRDTSHTQVISIVDNTPPVMDFSGFSISADRLVPQTLNCLADAIDIPNPVITDCNIAETTLSAYYQYVNSNGVPTGILYDAFVNDLMTFDLRNVPIGQEFVVVFVANDGCGNTSRDTSDIIMTTDTQAPNAVCEGSTSVVLNDLGEVEVMAETFDDHSFDNCGITNKLVRRYEETIYRDRIEFNCDDVANSPIKVVFRVYDAVGLYSDCVVNVYVQDKRPINLVCLGARTFNCDVTRALIIDSLNMEMPTFREACGATSLSLNVPQYTTTDCGYTNFVATWTATDANGVSTSCSRLISVGNSSQAEVVLPTQTLFELTSCGASTAPENIPNSMPTVPEKDCEHIAIAHEDTRLVGSNNACLKIIRNWTVIDWCLFDGGDISSALLANFDQTIKITDSGAPVFTSSCEDIEVTGSGQSCDQSVTLIATAMDSCTLEEDLTFTHTIDFYNDGTIDVTGVGNDASRVMDAGVHRVSFAVTDGCGNTATCSYLVTVRSTRPPRVELLSNIEVVMGSNGTVVLNAAATNISSSNGCLPIGVAMDATGLIFSFNEEGTQPTRTFTCTDIPDGKGVMLSVRVWVIDSLGNKESVPVNISVTDNEAMACPDITGTSAVISGNISDYTDQSVANVPVKLTNLSTGISHVIESNNDGGYSFENMGLNGSYKVEPRLDGFPLLGVSTLDILLIQRHILRLKTFDSAYKYIAADVNKSNSITAADLVIIRKLILGKLNSFNDESWRFVNSSYAADLEGDVYDYSNVIEINDLQEASPNNNFKGVKVGDVSGDAFPALAQGYAGPRSTKVMDVSAAKRGDIIRYTMSAHSLSELMGIQMAISLDDDMEVVALGSDNIALGDEHFVLTDDELRLSWTNQSAINEVDTNLFFIYTRVAGNEVPELQMNSQNLPGEFYDDNLTAHSMVLEMKSIDISDEFKVYQNSPNPFRDETSISFDLSQAGSALSKGH